MFTVVLTATNLVSCADLLNIKHALYFGLPITWLRLFPVILLMLKLLLGISRRRDLLVVNTVAVKSSCTSNVPFASTSESGTSNASPVFWISLILSLDLALVINIKFINPIFSQDIKRHLVVNAVSMNNLQVQVHQVIQSFRPTGTSKLKLLSYQARLSTVVLYQVLQVPIQVHLHYNLIVLALHVIQILLSRQPSALS